MSSRPAAEADNIVQQSYLGIFKKAPEFVRESMESYEKTYDYMVWLSLNPYTCIV